MNIDDAFLTRLKVHQIEKFLTGVLIRAKQEQSCLMLNPSSFQSIIYDDYINSLREWRSIYNTNGIKVNPNPFFPKYDIDIQDYQRYHEYVMHFVEDLIYHNMSKDKIILRDVIDYLKETDLRKNDNFVLYNNLSKLQRQYQVYILNQVSLATFECKNKEVCIDAFARLFQEGSYKGFAKYRMKGLNHPNLINYHKLLTENIPKDEMTGVLNNCMMRLDLNHEYKYVPTKELFNEYIDILLFNYKKQILDKIIKSLVESKGIEKTIENISEYIDTKQSKLLIDGDNIESSINRYLVTKYLKPKFINKLLIGEFNIDTFDLTFEEILNKYINDLVEGSVRSVKR